MTPDRTKIQTTNGEFEVSLEQLRTAATGIGASSGLTVQVVLDGLVVELLPLIESALSLPAGSISLGEALRLAREMELTPAPSARLPRRVNLRSALARLQGQWVALADEEIVANGRELKAVMAQAAGRDVTIMFVPSTGGDLNR